MEPYIEALIKHLELRFQQIGIIGAFNILGPKKPQADGSEIFDHLQMLAKQFAVINERALLQEWQTFKVLSTTGVLKVSHYHKLYELF